MYEEHQRVWDGKIRDDRFHGIVCLVCGDALTTNHWYDGSYVKGERCIVCGYEKVKHSWQYGNLFDAESHKMVCLDCDSYRWEAHRANSSGKCTVCGYQVNDAVVPETKPTENGSAETEPAETEPTEMEDEETRPAESEVVGTVPTETTSEETKPAEDEPDEAETAEIECTETKPAVLETMSEDAAKEDSQRSSPLWIWIAVFIVLVAGLGAAVFIRKKK